MEYLEIPSSAVSIVVYSFVGLSCLSFLYGVFGFILALLSFLRLGPRRFFRRVARPAPPAKALDPIHGTHEMIKLKVRSMLPARIVVEHDSTVLVVGHLHSLRVQRLAESADDSISTRLS